ncbi:hypothetical protein GGQ74_000250 [Desulfobaculum xiamenense]|uniref:Uncharacterized protein n=1 Tax=Desulfobaculum xiamenense TaxID=995050 RepID=A0A846QHL9_9BACT|nr:hypothetical protein [Desulfobaculum xiamenense]NJB66610.1 hypothetical protein [Desulfobaculum xiamenense]
MQIHSQTSQQPLPTDRAYVMSMTIKTFKGRRDVVVHLFRTGYDAATEDHAYPWQHLLGQPLDMHHTDDKGSRKVLLEAFTKEERDQILDYLAKRYEDRVSEIAARPMDFPIPLGLVPLSDIPEGQTIGFIRFDRTPNYSLPFAFHGLYDLSQHEPVVEEQD